MKSHIEETVQTLRTNFNTYKKNNKNDYEWRMKQLDGLEKMFVENRSEWNDALYKDLRQSKFLQAVEENMVIEDAIYLKTHLHKLMRTQPVELGKMGNFPTTVEQRPEPKGLVLIISAWNLPIALMGKPLAGAIAAGNAAVIKPSEIAPAVSALWQKFVPMYLDTNMYQCVEGGVNETQTLLAQKFDHIVYTGSSRVGKIVMKAAAEHLTTVTLELGGKCPCFIDKSVTKSEAVFQQVVERVVWGKLLISGQACIGVDYCLVEEDIADRLIKGLTKFISETYGEDHQIIQAHPDYSRIINVNHMQRIKALLDPVREYIVFGGHMDEKDLFIEPTIVLNPPADSLIMQEEIFGPILVINTVKNMQEGIDIANSKPHPLTVYIFSQDDEVNQHIIEQTTSGTVFINDCVTHYSESNIKFGGRGESGMGGLNGPHSFYELSHMRSVLKSLDSNSRKPFRTPRYSDQEVEKLNNLTLNAFNLKYVFPVLFFVLFWMTYLWKIISTSLFSKKKKNNINKEHMKQE